MWTYLTQETFCLRKEPLTEIGAGVVLMNGDRGFIALIRLGMRGRKIEHH